MDYAKESLKLHEEWKGKIEGMASRTMRTFSRYCSRV